MSKGFTKLEIILIVTILIIVSGFVVKSRIIDPSGRVDLSPVKNNGLCTKTTPYDNPPELVRALGFGKEKDVGAVNAPTLPPGSFKNCIHLIYKDHDEMNGAEGFFAFDNNSNANDLRIYVDNTYKGYDDLLTASLLTHEIRHATFFVKSLSGSPLPSCIDNEVAAFYSQMIFLSNLNPEEWKSITYRIGQNPHLNSAYEITNFLLLLNKDANYACPQDPDQSCWNSYVTDHLKSWILSNPYYQKQCGQN